MHSHYRQWLPSYMWSTFSITGSCRGSFHTKLPITTCQHYTPVTEHAISHTSYSCEEHRFYTSEHITNLTFIQASVQSNENKDMIRDKIENPWNMITIKASVLSFTKTNFLCFIIINPTHNTHTTYVRNNFRPARPFLNYTYIIRGVSSITTPRYFMCIYF